MIAFSEGLKMFSFPVKTYLRKLKKDGIIDGTTFQKILPSGSSPGVLYGLPKVHKAGCPYRPIV